MQQFSLSANIEEGIYGDAPYIVTPNARQVAEGIANGFKAGIHSYTIIGSYGTGKSSFLLALERDLKENRKYELLNPSIFSDKCKFDVLKIVGDYKELSALLGLKLSVEGTANSILDELRNRYNVSIPSSASCLNKNK